MCFTGRTGMMDDARTIAGAATNETRPVIRPRRVSVDFFSKTNTPIYLQTLPIGQAI